MTTEREPSLESRSLGALQAAEAEALAAMCAAADEAEGLRPHWDVVAAYAAAVRATEAARYRGLVEAVGTVVTICDSLPSEFTKRVGDHLRAALAVIAEPNDVNSTDRG